MLSSFGTTNFDLAVATFTAAALIGIAVAAQKKRKQDGGSYPPYAPCSTLETIRMVSSSEYPWWSLRVARELKSRVFQLSLPFPVPMVVSVGEVDTFRKVLKDQQSKKPDAIYKHMRFFQGTPTMFTSNDQPWHSRRMSVAPSFSSNHVKRMNNVAIDKTEDWIAKKLYPLVEAGHSFDVGKEMINITLDAICETAFEYNMSTDEKVYFTSELELALTEFALKAPTNPLRRLFGLLLPDRRRAFTARKNLQQLAMKIQNSYRSLEKPAEGTVINLIMNSDAFKTDIERAAQIAELLVAGHDTTGYSISWILLELARNPTEQRRLRESLSLMSREEWSRCDTLKMIVKEGMRLHPVASAGTIRVIGKDITTSNKHLLPKGSIVFLPFISLFRNPEIFKDENSFCPLRWENPSRDMLDAFTPFSLGKRICIGQSLARAQMYYIVARICSEFDLCVEEEGSVDFFLNLKPVGARLKATKVA